MILTQLIYNSFKTFSVSARILYSQNCNFINTCMAFGVLLTLLRNKSPNLSAKGLDLASSVSPLFRYESFRSMVVCTDVFDGKVCFNQYGHQLFRDVTSKLPKDSAEGFKQCVGIAANATNNMYLMLSIQHCDYSTTLDSKITEIQNYGDNLKSAAILLTSLIVCFQFFVFLQTKYQDHRLVKIQQTVNQDEASVQEVTIALNDRKKENDNNSERIASLLTAMETLQGELTSTKTSVKEMRASYGAYVVSHELKMKSSPEVQVNSDTKFEAHSPLSGLKPETNSYNPYSFLSGASAETRNLFSKPLLTKVTSNKVSPKVEICVSGKTFDLANPEGLKRWKDFVQATRAARESNSEANPQAEAVLNENKDEEEEKKAETLDKVSLYDKNGKPFRRLYVPGLGWISSKKFQNNEYSIPSNSIC